METLDYQNYHILINRKSKNKNTYFRIKTDGTILVTCPYHIKTNNLLPYLDSFILKITKKYDLDSLNKLDYLDNGNFIFLNKTYTIKIEITHSKEKVYIDNDTLFVFLNKPENAQKRINKFIEKQADIILTNRYIMMLEKFEHINFIPKLSIKNMTSRFGVCYYKQNKISLASMLIHYDYECIDYVIIHELAHFIHPNHSKKFYYLIEMYLPNYKNAERKLKNRKVSY